MNNINSQHESTVVGQRFSFKADIDFIQYGIRDVIGGLSETIIGKSYDPTKTYILKGCEKTSFGGVTTISPGYIYGISKSYGGMSTARTYIYYHNGSSFADPVGGNVVICRTISSFSTDDPTPFTDSVSRNVHEIINVEFLSGASGSGDVDFSDLVNLYQFINKGGTSLNGDTVSLDCNKTIFYPTQNNVNDFIVDCTNMYPGAELIIGVIVNSGDTVSISGFTVPVPFGIPLQFTHNYTSSIDGTTIVKIKCLSNTPGVGGLGKFGCLSIEFLHGNA